MRCIVVGLLCTLVACQRSFAPLPLAAGELPPASVPQAPDFTLPTAAGQALTLSSLRGQYVLLVFWAPECARCWAETPNQRKLYAQFHSRGLAIVTVWRTARSGGLPPAVAADTLPGRHVLDRRGAVARAYGVRALPGTVLLNPAGQELARNLHGRALGQKISEYIPLD